ncbi:uncharacterized protein ARMOST_11998 [Armillaria ostoyae]|uniref:Uncharacterized protein n=1 Tax=Armillaria ostoyae TaxID=47428 RepID=A0A284RIP0_ARMOS|nr:uncharacterized protein ARMOST_11998 [Armillaria ostoyae]
MSSRRTQTRRNTSKSLPSTCIHPPCQNHSLKTGEQTTLSSLADFNDYLDEYALQTPSTASGIMTSTNYVRLRLHLQRVPASGIDFFVDPGLQDRYFTYSLDVDTLLYRGTRAASQDEIPYILSRFISKKRESPRALHTRIQREYSFIPYEVVTEYFRRLPRPAGGDVRIAKEKKRNSFKDSEKENYPLSRNGVAKPASSTTLSLSSLPFPFAYSFINAEPTLSSKDTHHRSAGVIGHLGHSLPLRSISKPSVNDLEITSEAEVEEILLLLEDQVQVLLYP